MRALCVAAVLLIFSCPSCLHFLLGHSVGERSRYANNSYKLAVHIPWWQQQPCAKGSEEDPQCQIICTKILPRNQTSVCETVRKLSFLQKEIQRVRVEVGRVAVPRSGNPSSMPTANQSSVQALCPDGAWMCTCYVSGELLDILTHSIPCWNAILVEFRSSSVTCIMQAFYHTFCMFL